jgi:hypothetical protein
MKFSLPDSSLFPTGFAAAPAGLSPGADGQPTHPFPWPALSASLSKLPLVPATLSASLTKGAVKPRRSGRRYPRRLRREGCQPVRTGSEGEQGPAALQDGDWAASQFPRSSCHARAGQDESSRAHTPFSRRLPQPQSHGYASQADKPLILLVLKLPEGSGLLAPGLPACPAVIPPPSAVIVAAFRSGRSEEAAPRLTGSLPTPWLSCCSVLYYSIAFAVHPGPTFPVDTTNPRC